MAKQTAVNLSMLWGKILCIFYFLALLTPLSGQQLQFEIIALNKKIGDARIILKTDSTGRQYYSLSSTMQVKVLLFKMNATVRTESVFKDGFLESSIYKGTKNGETILTRTVCQNGVQQVDKSGVKRHLSKQVSFSGLQLYFLEPGASSTIFSERDGAFVVIENLGNHTYRAPIASQTGVYKYVNGKLIEIEITTAFGKVYFKAV